MRRARSRRAGARASLCHRPPGGSSAVMTYRWRGQERLTTSKELFAQWFSPALRLGVVGQYLELIGEKYQGLAVFYRQRFCCSQAELVCPPAVIFWVAGNRHGILPS